MKHLTCANFTLVAAMVPIVFMSAAMAADAPSTDDVKRALERRMMALKPVGTSDRNVLFEDVRAAGSSGQRSTFHVTGSVRDYGKGYPANKHYGETCVGRMDKMPYVVWRNASGEWQVDGRMTLDSKCSPNPAADQTSVPLASLRGSPAPAAAPPTAAGQAAKKDAMARLTSSEGLRLGAYECWHFSRPRMLLNFTLQRDGRYLDTDSKPGTYTFDTGSRKIRFKGGALDGQAPVYHEPKGQPTASFRNNEGTEVSFCEFAG